LLIIQYNKAFVEIALVAKKPTGYFFSIHFTYRLLQFYALATAWL